MPEGSNYTSETEVAEWIEGLKTDGVVRLELRPAAGERTMWRRALASNSDSGGLANKVIARAVSSGRGMNCVRASFFLRAFDASGGDAVDEQLIVVAGGNAGKGESSEEGTASERLNVHLLKSHAELHRLLMSSHEGRHVADARTIAQLQQRVDKQEGQYVKVLELHEVLVSKQHEREEAERRFKLDEKKQEMIGKKLDQVTPIVMNRLLGGGPGKGTPFMGEEMLKQLLGNLTKDTIDKIMQGLPAEQSALFAELYMAYAAAHEAEQRKINEGASSSSASAGGAAGAGAAGTTTNGTHANGANGKINGKDGAS